MQLPTKYNKFKQFGFYFFTIFVLVFSSIKYSFLPYSTNNVEQWANLVNQTFYSNNDFMFSYGPLYWLMGGTTYYNKPFYIPMYNELSCIISLIYSSIIIALFWAIILLNIKHKVNYLILAIIYTSLIHIINIPSAFYLLPFIIIATIDKHNNFTVKWQIYLIIGCYIGFTFYIRFYFGLIGLLVTGSYIFQISVKNCNFIKRYIIAFLLGTALGYFVTGAIVFHYFKHTIDYFIINTQLNFGNSIDMTLAISNSITCFIAIFICLLCLNIYAFKDAKFLVLPFNIIFLILFKMGFSRADHYYNYFVINIAIISLTILYSNKILAKTLTTIIFISLLYITNYPSKTQSWLSTKSLKFNIDFNKSYQDRMSEIYYNFKLPEKFIQNIQKQTIDAYPYNNEYMFANYFNYHYRPIFQNYMTLTPKLDKINQTFFESDSAPVFILWTGGLICNNNPKCNIFDGFDEKYTLNEDPLTSSIILLNYHIIDITNGKDNNKVALFKKNETPKKYSYKILNKQNMRFGIWYNVPSIKSGVIKLVPTFEFTTYAKLKNLLFKGSLLYINYRFANGLVKRYRLNILNAQSGIWINPYLDDFSMKGANITSIMFEVNETNYFNPEFLSMWIQIPIKNITTYN